MSRIKQCLIAPLGWTYLSIDYSQLEIIGSALVTGDPNLKEDIRNDIDQHLLRLSQATGTAYSNLKLLFDAGDVKTIKARKDIKQYTFRRSLILGVL